MDATSNNDSSGDACSDDDGAVAKNVGMDMKAQVAKCKTGSDGSEEEKVDESSNWDALKKQQSVNATAKETTRKHVPKVLTEKNYRIDHIASPKDQMDAPDEGVSESYSNISGNTDIVAFKDQVRGQHRSNQSTTSTNTGAESSLISQQGRREERDDAIGHQAQQPRYGSHDNDIGTSRVPSNVNANLNNEISVLSSENQSTFMAEAYLVNESITEDMSNERIVVAHDVPPAPTQERRIRNGILVAIIAILVTVVAVLVGTVPCWGDSCKTKESPASILLMPSGSPISLSPTNVRVSFEYPSDLSNAVDAFLDNPNSTELITTYGRFENWDVSSVNDFSYLFAARRNRKAVNFNEDLSNWNVSSATSMAHMFNGCIDFNANISQWDVSSVTKMSSMFFRCSSFNASISTWNVSSVTDMSSMFTKCLDFAGDLSQWDLSSTHKMAYMFSYASKFNNDLSAWDVSSVVEMNGLFHEAKAFNGNISRWDVSSATNMSWMFAGADVFNADISRWDVSSVEDLSKAFRDASNFNADISRWNVSSAIDLSFMFQNAVRFNADISRWNVVSAEDMEHMFHNAKSFDGDLSRWNLDNAHYLEGMFSHAKKFNSNISNWNVANVYYMAMMFEGADNFNGDLSRWDVSGAQDLTKLFRDAKKFNADISKWDVSSVGDMEAMFQGAVSFNANLSLWDVSNIVSLDYTFAGAASFNGSGIGAWNVGKVSTMGSTFLNASSFDANLSMWDVSMVEDTSYMFGNTQRFKGVGIEYWELSSSCYTYGMFCNASGLQPKQIDAWNVSLDDTFSC